MQTLLWILLAGYAVGMLLPLCLPGRREAQALASSVSAITATGAGIALGCLGLTAPEPVTGSLVSTVPLLTFAIRIDPLASFFVLTISLAGLAASIYAVGYLRHFDDHVSVAELG